MPARVYLETSYISFCVTDRTDPVSVYRRDSGREWWALQASRHDLFVSAEVVAELTSPGYRRGGEALEMIEGIPLLPISDEVRGLAEVLVHEKVMPEPVAGDAVHVAVATVHDIDYIVSWNVRHLANPRKAAHLQTICLRFGLLPPQIVTPEFLWEEDDNE